ncbi:hypothetical protein AYL99_00289 [Fonsecaea erecta]|uniref:NACHT domain-containing protein n=1 Tax=Fonsecaea erecta TaxID=1367422 RepID=A0A178ZXA0_9EURO|nr:hypothetical protein AYL99_00289 [Fonsecaea erecta]OAP64317.1 hypothetical protein AYL99_00289 [Fonsecaea erecta]
MSSTTKLGRLWAKNPPPDNADACLPSKSSRWDSSRFRKFLSGHDKPPEDDSLQTPPVNPDASPKAEHDPIGLVAEHDATAPGEPHNIWVRAEKKLTKNDKTNKVWQQYLEILESELGAKLEPSGTVERQQQLYKLLEIKAKELVDKRWKVQLGGHEIQVRTIITQACKNLLHAKDQIQGVAKHIAPQAVHACTGMAMVLTLIIQAAEHNAALLKGLKCTSALICRLPIMEDLYLPTQPWSARPAHFDAFQQKFEEGLTTLYSLVLEYQARALRYLKRVWAAQVLRDMAKLDTWEGLLMSIEKSEDALRSYTQLLDAEEMKRRFDEIRETQENDVRFRITSTLDQKVNKCLQILDTCPYRERKNRNTKRVLGTCEWFTSHPRFHEWQNKGSGLLWVSADPGCGKSVLARYLIDEVVLSTSQRTTCYFFFKDDSEDQKTAANAICAILRQLFLEKPDLLQESILSEFQTKKDTHVSSFSDLWNTLLSVAADPNAGEIVCILDALDECQDRDRSRLIQALTELYSTNYLSNLKFLLTSRPYGHIGREFRELEKLLPSIHLRGENDDEIKKISLEIDLVIRSRVEDIGNKWSLKQYERVFLHEQLTAVPFRQRSYLWVHLTLDAIENMEGFTKGGVRRAVQQLPQSVDGAYTKILEGSRNPEKARKLLHIIIGATRPLTVGEMAMMMALDGSHKSYDDIEQELEPDERFETTLRDICGLFVVIIDKKVYLLHQTAKEFLVRDNASPLTDSHPWKHSIQLEESHRLLAERCIWYLCSNFIEASGGVLLDYACYNWPSHFREAGISSNEKITVLARKLCKEGSKEYTVWFGKYGSRYWFPKSSSSLPMASYFGLAGLVELLLEKGAALESRDSRFDRTPLFWAVRNRHEAVVKLLLDRGAEVDTKDKTGQTPLVWARHRGRTSLVKLLLEHGATNPA